VAALKCSVELAAPKCQYVIFPTILIGLVVVAEQPFYQDSLGAVLIVFILGAQYFQLGNGHFLQRRLIILCSYRFRHGDLSFGHFLTSNKMILLTEIAEKTTTVFNA
jgi:hypothetical protein